jgi:hypothetical protein
MEAASGIEPLYRALQALYTGLLGTFVDGKVLVTAFWRWRWTARNILACGISVGSPGITTRTGWRERLRQVRKSLIASRRAADTDHKTRWQPLSARSTGNPQGRVADTTLTSAPTTKSHAGYPPRLTGPLVRAYDRRCHASHR